MRLPPDFFELLDLPELFFALERPRDLLLPPRDFALPRDFAPARPLLRDAPRLDEPLDFRALFFALDLREPPDFLLDFELPPRDFDFREPVDFFALLFLREEPRADPLAFLLDRPELPRRRDELRPPPPEGLDPPPPPELCVIRCAATAPSTPPTTAPIGPATLPITAPVAAPAAGFGIWMLSDEDDCEPCDLELWDCEPCDCELPPDC